MAPMSQAVNMFLSTFLYFYDQFFASIYIGEFQKVMWPLEKCGYTTQGKYADVHHPTIVHLEAKSWRSRLIWLNVIVHKGCWSLKCCTILKMSISFQEMSGHCQKLEKLICFVLDQTLSPSNSPMDLCMSSIHDASCHLIQSSMI